MRTFIYSLLFLMIFITGCKQPTSKKSPSIIASIGAGQAHNLILQQTGNASFSLVDVRTPSEFNGGHIDGSINIDWLNQSNHDTLLQLPKSNTILLYCRSGRRSLAAANYLKSNGFTSILNIQGGIIEWNQVIGSYQPDPTNEITID